MIVALLLALAVPAAAESGWVIVREPLFVPLEMTRHFAAEDVLYERVAAGHTVRDGTAVRVRGRLSESTNRDPVGGVRSTMTDLLRYARFHLGDGTAPDGAQLLPAAALVAMREPRVEMGAAGHVGLAWFSTTAAAHEWSPTAGPSRT